MVASPDKNDPFKCAIDNYTEPHYYSVKKSGKIFDDACKQKGFSIFHCNIRSLGKSKSLLHNNISTVKTTPDIIAILESKINENTSANLNIPGYTFVNTNSKTQAGGGIKASCQSCSQNIFNMPVMSTNTIPHMHRNRIFT